MKRIGIFERSVRDSLRESLAAAPLRCDSPPAAASPGTGQRPGRALTRRGTSNAPSQGSRRAGGCRAERVTLEIQQPTPPWEPGPVPMPNPGEVG